MGKTGKLIGMDENNKGVIKLDTNGAFTEVRAPSLSLSLSLSLCHPPTHPPTHPQVKIINLKDIGKQLADDV